MRLIDVLDVGIVAFIVYRILLLIKGTRAMQMLTGLGVITLMFFLSSQFEFFATHWLLAYFFDHLIIIVIVLFQDDLRRALTTVGKNPFFTASISEKQDQEIVDEVVRASYLLSKDRIGALIVVERETGLKNFIDTGSKLEARVRSETLYAIFMPSSPIHDGAVIISEGRIAAAGCFLPISVDPSVDKRYGTRHRAALGLTSDSDAIVILVSEETGRVHLAKNGKITANLNEQELRQSLTALLDIPDLQVKIPVKMRDWFQSIRRDSGEN